MRFAFMYLSILVLASCSYLAPGRDTITDAQRACSVGFSEKSNSVVKGAFEVAKAKGSASAEANFSTEFSNALTETLKSVKADNPQMLDLVLKEIAIQRQCVLDQVGKNYLPTQEERTRQCVEGIKLRISDPNTNYPPVKNWIVNPKDPRASGDDFILRFFVDHRGTMSYWGEVLCVVKNQRVYDIQPIEPLPERKN